jgi:FdrA protein
MSEKTSETAAKPKSLLGQSLNVINVGLEGFAKELDAQGVAVTHVQWSPPAGGDAKMAALLAKLGT